ncbi:hypothetical protein [Saccharococcus caldoxylosilyticus]|uniref:Uncharacterized protein n=1 Tax=Saccharococcus caldoxylosilyticus TaxID=81408 RepID=A0A150LBI9_9BACL|nr:hypothetical protein [Parageobacillus caldoxylosilyticus]KYD09615.1 hypothetical protein B4119_2053 [Parageobacillus caldoxylosilyticus]MBB3854221.1 hypothetical protein [Parageobacillus caldoxylosilyticus]
MLYRNGKVISHKVNILTGVVVIVMLAGFIGTLALSGEREEND